MISKFICVSLAGGLGFCWGHAVGFVSDDPAGDRLGVRLTLHPLRHVNSPVDFLKNDSVPVLF